MKKISFYGLLVSIVMVCGITFATENDINNDDIPSMTIDEFMIMNKAKQSKVDIIKKNNIEMEELKNHLKERIIQSADKINSLRIDTSVDEISFTDETLQELKALLQFLQESKATLETDVE